MTTITIEGKEYTMASIKMGVGRKIQTADKGENAIQFISSCLLAGGHTEATPEWIDENFPYYIDGEPSIVPLMAKAYEANGFKTKVEKPGEGQPPVEAAESTSNTSTVV